MPRLPTYFISHGGGPWPWVPAMRTRHAALEASLAKIPSDIGTTPSAVLMVSGHWETDDFTVMTSPAPTMLYDYNNFPPETYEVVYPAPGAPQIAARAAELIGAAGLPVKTNPDRGFDHGTFVPAFAMYPEAEVPFFQVSIRQSYDPEDHFALGRALAPLRDEGVLIIGSGLSYHNLRMLGAEGKEPSAVFDAWLHEALALPPSERTAALRAWETAPQARQCHTREDHLVPIFAALGAAEDAPATRVYHETDFLGALTTSSYRFG